MNWQQLKKRRQGEYHTWAISRWALFGILFVVLPQLRTCNMYMYLIGSRRNWPNREENSGRSDKNKNINAIRGKKIIYCTMYSARYTYYCLVGWNEGKVEEAEDNHEREIGKTFRNTSTATSRGNKMDRLTITQTDVFDLILLVHWTNENAWRNLPVLL